MLAVTHVEMDEVHAGLGQQVGHDLVRHPAMYMQFDTLSETHLRC